MNRKTVIVLLAVVIALFVGVMTAVIVLYSGLPTEKAPRVRTEKAVRVKVPKMASKKMTGKVEEEFLMVVPTDAVLVFTFGSLQNCVTILGGPRASLPLVANVKLKNLLDQVASAPSKELGDILGEQLVLSYHNVGALEPLLVLDLCGAEKALPTGTVELTAMVEKAGLQYKILNCGASAPEGGYLRKRQILLISTSDVLLASSQRHIERGVSVYDKEMFPEAAQAMKGAKNALYLSHESIGKVMSELLYREFSSKSDAVRRFADWTAFAIEPDGNRLKMSGLEICGSSSSKFMNVFEGLATANVTVPGIVPAYAISVFSLPIDNVAKEIEAYEEFFHTKSGKAKYQNELTRLRQAAKIGPVTWADSLNIKELAVASFYAKGELESVILIKVGSTSVLGKGRLFPGLNVKSAAQAMDYPFEGFTSALFGGLFGLKNESKYTYINGWLVVGSPVAIAEYVSGRALESSLSEQFSGAGVNADLKNQHFWGYFSLTENSRVIDRVFREKYANSLKTAYDSVAYAPAILSLNVAKGSKNVNLDVQKVYLVKSKAPEIERDTVVIVPKGPWKVMNSGTGKMNSFYQQSNMFLCLADENGKGLWGAPFKTPICGRAGTIDYFANGKLQILFASGSKLYLIDRTGRMVAPFPVELGKEVLLGPDIYDFNSLNRYNVMVLHKDNVIDMYNLKGQKPADWKGITHAETIKTLPELLTVDGKMFWAVRTSLQTLIYPFYGGEPLTSFKGNDKIRPDSKLTTVPGGVRAVNYNGKEITIKLK